MAEYDVIIIGGGILGLCTAYQLTKHHKRVLLLEQFNIPHTRGSSSGGSRLIRNAYPDKNYAALMPESYREWEEIQCKTSTDLLRITGMLLIQSQPRDFYKDSLEAMKREKMAYNIIGNKREFNEKYPSLNYDESHVALNDPSAGVLRANKCIIALQRLVLQQGGIIEDECRVDDIIPGAIVTVISAGNKQYKARTVILTPGSWAPQLLKCVGLNLPIRTMPGFQCFWRLRDNCTYDSTDPKCPALLHWMQKDEGGYQFVYAIPSWEYPGLIKVATRFEPNPYYLSPEYRDTASSKEIVEYLSVYIKEHMPFLHPTPSLIEPCMYAVTDDKHYIVDRHPVYKNILIGAGLSGHGFKTAPVLGKLLTELALDLPPSYDMSAFSISRFSKAMQQTAKL